MAAFLVVRMISFLFISLVFAQAQAQAQAPSSLPPPVSNEPSALALKPTDLEETVTPTTILPSKINILSHKATYEITLLSTYGDEDINDVKGFLTIQLIDTTDGWAVEQKSSLIIYDSAGEGEQINTTFLSWESKDGNRYHFYGRTLQNNTQEDIIEGDATKTEDGKEIQVIYKNPQNLTIGITPVPVFPTNFLIKALEQAACKLKFFSTIVFDGSSETHEPVEVNTVFGCRGEQSLVLLSKDGNSSANVSFWPMNMAVYSLKSGTPEAEYEISQTVMENGIIKSMTQDYGAFKVIATLNQVDLLK